MGVEGRGIKDGVGDGSGVVEDEETRVEGSVLGGVDMVVLCKGEKQWGRRENYPPILLSVTMTMGG